MDDLWAMKSKDDGLIVCAISFKDFQPMWSWSTSVTDGLTVRHTDGQTTCDRKTVLCTMMHRAVKTLRFKTFKNVIWTFVKSQGVETLCRLL